MSQLSARPRRPIPRRGPMGIVQNFPSAPETPQSPCKFYTILLLSPWLTTSSAPSGRYTPPTDNLSILGIVSREFLISRFFNSFLIVSQLIPRWSDNDRQCSSPPSRMEPPHPSLRCARLLETREHLLVRRLFIYVSLILILPIARLPLSGRRERPERVLGMEVKPFNPKAAREALAPVRQSRTIDREAKPCKSSSYNLPELNSYLFLLTVYVLVPSPREYRSANRNSGTSPRKPQLATMVATPLRPVTTHSSASGGSSESSADPSSSSSSSSDSDSDSETPSVSGAEARSESTHEPFVTAGSPFADVEPNIATPAASPPPAPLNEAAFRRSLIREANRMEREQLQKDLAVIDRITRLRELNPPGSSIFLSNFPLLMVVSNSVSCSCPRGRRYSSPGKSFFLVKFYSLLILFVGKEALPPQTHPSLFYGLSYVLLLQLP